MALLAKKITRLRTAIPQVHERPVAYRPIRVDACVEVKNGSQQDLPSKGVIEGGAKLTQGSVLHQALTLANSPQLIGEGKRNRLLVKTLMTRQLLPNFERMN